VADGTAPQKSRMKLNRVRRLSQALFFLAFLGLILQARPLLDAGVRVDSFIRLSPFAGLAAFLTSHRLAALAPLALVVLLAAVLLGRAFCGWVCPFGTTLDLTDRLLRPLRGKERPTYDGRRIKYYLLAFILVLALLGVQLAGWFDPLCIAMRTYALVVQPLTARSTGDLLGALGGIAGIGSVAHAARSGALNILGGPALPAYGQFAAVMLMFIAVAFLSLFRSRYWCRNLCPLGAMLALASMASLLKRRVSDGCTRCGRCARVCGMGAIPTEDPRHTLAGECTLCMNCRTACPEGVITFGPRSLPHQNREIDLSRRWFLGTAVAASATVPAIRIVASARKGYSPRVPIRPPGALPEEEFLKRCIRCGTCIRVCPTNAIQPAGLENGIEGLWAPRLIPRTGACDYRCNRCTQVCPTRAIEPLPLERKQHTAIGLARINRSRCIPWVGSEAYSQGKSPPPECNCGVCEEFCPVPTKAIRFNIVNVPGVGEIRRPYVVESLCIGCGNCERVCPVAGRAAIEVEGRRAFLEPAQESALADFFPAMLAGLTRLDAPKVYEGAKGLWDYIDGGAEPYLTYSFMRAATCHYVNGTEQKLKVDIWEFADADDAFGVFGMDCGTGARKVSAGDAAAILPGVLWMRHGHYVVTLRVQKGVLNEDLMITAAREVARILPGSGVAPPAMLALLPEAGRVPCTEVFARSSLALTKASEDRGTYLAERTLPEEIFAKGTAAVMAQYETGEKKAWLVIAGPSGGTIAQRLRALRLAWKQPEEVVNGALAFAERDGFFAAQKVHGDWFVGVFRAPSKTAALELLQQAPPTVR